MSPTSSRHHTRGAPRISSEPVRTELLLAHRLRQQFLKRCYHCPERKADLTSWALERVVVGDPLVRRSFTEVRSRMIEKLLETSDPQWVAAQTSPSRHGPLLWLQVVAAYEARMLQNQVWDDDIERYLQHLRALGYAPAAVELAMVSRS